MKFHPKLPATFLAFLVMIATLAGNALAAIFPVATNPALVDFSGGAVVAGTNYLVGFVAGTNVTAQMISSSGQLVGSPLVVGANPGFPPAVTFTGAKTNALVAWSDTSKASGVTMFGQLISTNGTLVGTKFPLLATLGSHGFQFVQAAAGDGTNFLVVWQDAANKSYYGQRVTAAGALSGAEFPLSATVNNAGERNVALAFGRTNYLFAWQSGSNNSNHTYAQFLSPSGATSAVLQVNTTASLDKNPTAVAFDGTNYLVVWSRDTQYTSGGGPLWNLFGRLVSPAGAALGSELVLATEIASFPALAFDGDNYLLAWGFDSTTTNADVTIHARWLDRAGNTIGPSFTPFPPQGTNPPLLPLNGVLYDGQRFVLTATFGSFILNGSGDVTGFSGGDVYGKFLVRSTTPPVFTNSTVVAGQFQGQLRVVPGQTYTIETSSNLLVWTPVGVLPSDTNTLDLLDERGLAQSGQLFYRAVIGNLLGVSTDFHFLEFANAGNFGSGFTPTLSLPVLLNSYSAALNVKDDFNLPTATNVFFTGPAGSGLTNAPANPDNSSLNDTDAFYQSSFVNSPAAAPGGTWTVNYHGTNLSFTVPDPQAAARLVVPLPTVTVNGGVVQSVNWIYKNATTGTTLAAAPTYMAGIQVQINGIVGGRIYNSPTLTGVTSHTLTSVVNWSNVQGITLAYDDTLGNHYVVTFFKP